MMTVVRVVGIVLHLIVGWFYITTGLVAPGWAVVLLLTVWIALFVFVIRVWRSRPMWVLGVPFLAAAIWVITLLIGGTLLGWTA